ncbi:MAG: hypothetical protein J7L54_06750 [Elusimicrobia bacterium]|nr:hypothetical protein [Elusimicrobiota bacterium]
MENIKEAKRKIVNIAGLVSSRFSLSPIAGQIYALLYVSSEPVSLNDMVRELKISKGSASTNIRALEAWGAVRKVWVNSDRKDYYEANPDIEGIALRRIREGLKKRLAEVSPHIEALEEVLKKGGKSKETKFIAERFGKIKRIFSLIEEAAEVIPEKATAGKLAIFGKIAKLIK